MTNLFGVIGESGTGKSGVIRSLSGVTRRCEWNISQISIGDKSFWVEVRSLQENGIDPAAACQDLSKYEWVLIGLREKPMQYYGTQMPDAMSYLQAFRGHGFSLRGVAFMENTNKNLIQSAQGMFSVSVAPPAINRTRASNYNSAAIASAWQWH